MLDRRRPSVLGILDFSSCRRCCSHLAIGGNAAPYRVNYDRAVAVYRPAARSQFLRNLSCRFVLVGEHFLRSLDNLGGSIEDIFRQRFQVLAGCRFDIHPAPFRFVTSFGVIQSLHIGVSQNSDSFGRRAGCNHHGPAKLSRCQQDPGNTAAIFRDLMTIKDLLNSRRFRCPRISLARGLE